MAEVIIGIDVFDKDRWTKDEREYFRIIDEACANKHNAVLSNSKPTHAAYIIHKFFENAEQQIRLFSGKLMQNFNGVSVYNNPCIIQKAVEFLRRPGTKFLVLLEKRIDTDSGEVEDHPLIQTLQKEVGNSDSRIEVRQVPPELFEVLSKGNYARNWMVMDNQAYRLEMDAEKAQAYVNFGDPELASGLGRVFDVLFERSRKLYPSD